MWVILNSDKKSSVEKLVSTDYFWCGGSFYPFIIWEEKIKSTVSCNITACCCTTLNGMFLNNEVHFFNMEDYHIMLSPCLCFFHYQINSFMKNSKSSLQYWRQMAESTYSTRCLFVWYRAVLAFNWWPWTAENTHIFCSFFFVVIGDQLIRP